MLKRRLEIGRTRPTPVPHRIAMKDIVFVSLTVAFFAASWLYAVSFKRL